MVKAKILIVGPCETGKTYICNFLAGATESSGGEYHPTQGVRILEFEVEGESPATGKTVQVEVELWDCSGSRQFEHCWPAFAKDTDGVVLVHNPSQPLLQEKELERWYSYFVNQQELQTDQCMILTHHKQTSTDHQEEHTQLSSEKLSHVHRVDSDLEDNPDAVREAFYGFLLNTIESRQRREERSIIDGDRN